MSPGGRPEGRRPSAPRPPWHLQLAVAASVAVLSEQVLHAVYASRPHLLAQRETELYGGLSMLALLLTLAARPLRLLPYRRALGLSACASALAHTGLAYVYVLGGDWENVLFLGQAEQAALYLGALATLGLLPLALTSTDAAMRRLGERWKTLHRLGPAMTLLAALHTAWIGVHFGLAPLTFSSVTLLGGTLALLLFRRKVRV